MAVFAHDIYRQEQSIFVGIIFLILAYEISSIRLVDHVVGLLYKYQLSYAVIAPWLATALDKTLTLCS